jgi:hypothetical protein
LAFLKNAGMKIPITWVVTEFDREKLDVFIKELVPGEYAIRSLARGEDGAEFSFDGQFETYFRIC